VSSGGHWPILRGANGLILDGRWDVSKGFSLGWGRWPISPSLRSASGDVDGEQRCEAALVVGEA
jgi:hypothetical protein